jgi:ABC-type Na+ efflux pump permease subunit
LRKNKSRIVAWTDLRIALKLRIVKGSLILASVMGPIVAVLFLAVPHVVSSIPDIQVYRAFMIPTIAGLIGMFSLVPASFISANAIVGEREQNTLEPLLCTPLTDRELLWGKVLSSIIPSYLVLVVQILASSVGVNVILLTVGESLLAFPDMPNLFLLMVVTPLLILAVISMTIIISGRVSRVYEAYQSIGALAFIFMVPTVGAFLTIGLGMPGLMWTSNFILLLISVTLAISSWLVAVSRFDRDKMISRI